MKHNINNNGFDLILEKSEPTMVVPVEETPRGLYFLSNLDQNKIRLSPNGRRLDTTKPEDQLHLLVSLEENIGTVVSTVYCFKSPEKGNGAAAEVVRDALARVLVHYYPLAGRLGVSSDGKLAVECSGEGAVFVAAEAGCRMEEVIHGDVINPDPMVLGKLVYDFLLDKPKSILDVPLVMAQVTKFKCGGFILGLTLSHVVMDGVSATAFVKAWGDEARGLPVKKPVLNRGFLRARNPPRIEFLHPEFHEMPPSPRSDGDEDEEEELERKTLNLDTKFLERLKYKALEDGAIDRCTTFEALTAFVWKARTIALSGTDSNPNQYNNEPSKLVFPVDGRSRFNPPLPEGYFGNAIVLTTCTCTEGELARGPLSSAVVHVQKAIEGVTDRFMRSAIDYYEVTRARPSLKSMLLVTTWARLSFAQTDFGWGEPTLSGPVGFPCKEVVMLLSNGVERESMSISLLVALPSRAMKRFQDMVDSI